MIIEELKTLVSSNLAFAGLLYSYLQEYGEELPAVFGKASNQSERLRKLIGPDRKLDLSKDSDGMRGLLAHKDERIRKLAEAKLACSSWPLHIRRVENLIGFSAARHGRIGIPAKYSSATTHRNAGTDGINLYNLPARPKKGYELISEIKKLIHAPKGYSLITVDYSQIEARYLAYIAGQEDLVKAFASGEDVYSTFGTKTFCHTVRKPRLEDPPPIRKRLTADRNFSKTTILGAGYGCGASTFFNRCTQDDTLKPLITSELAERIIKAYRKTYSCIPKLWREAESMFRFVHKYPEEQMKMKCGIVVEHEQKYNQIVVTLPSKSKLYYQDVRSYKSSGNLKWKHSRGAGFYGASLVENYCQSTCRDILVDAILRLKKAGYVIVSDLYDSLTVLVKTDDVGKEQEKVERLMTIVPEWCIGMPLAVESEVKEHM
jgi:hypothetical protein